MVEMKPLSGRRKAYDRILRILLYFCALLVCALLVFIIGYVFVRGLPHVSWSFLTTETSYIKDTIGILPHITNTVYLVVGTLLITLPLGVGAAGMNDFFRSLGDFFHASGSSLTVALYVYARERAEFDVAFAIAAILMLLTLAINLAAKLVGKRLKKK